MHTNFIPKKWLMTTLLMLFPAYLMAAKLGDVKGKVINSKNEPIISATVVLNNQNEHTLTNDKGEFNLSSKLESASYLTVFCMGYETKIVPLLKESNSQTLIIELKEKEILLDEVRVEANQVELTSSRKNLDMGGKLSGILQEVPQSISVISQRLMLDKQAFQVSDVIHGVSGVAQSSSYDDVTIRGFRNGYENGLRLVNGLRSGYGYGTSYFRSPLTINLESIEIIKGPSSSLFGDIAPGGTINMVTKKPLTQTQGRISVGGGSFETWRTTLDLTGPLDKNKTILYRLNMGYEYAMTFRDNNRRKNYMIAPYFTIKPLAGTQLDIDLIYDSFDGYLDRGMGIKRSNRQALSRSFSVGQPSDYFKTNTMTLSARLAQQLAQNLELNLSYMGAVYEEDLNEHRTLNSFANPENTIMNMRFMQRKAKDFTQNLVAYLQWNTKKESWKNALTLGFDYGEYKGAKDNQQKEARQKIVNGESVPITFDLDHPQYQNQDINSYVWRAQAPFPFLSPNSTRGVYLIDQLDLGSRLNLVMAFRFEDYRSKSVETPQTKASQQVWLPRLGLNYKLTKQVRLFASYTEGYVPLPVNYITNHEDYGSHSPFKAESSYQVEAGLKNAFLKDRLFVDLALFHIERRNMMVATGEINEQGFSQFRQSGKAVSQGLELDIKGLLTYNLSVDANYTHNQTKLKSSSIASEVGLPLAAAPKHTANIWLRYQLDNPTFRGLSLALGYRYVGKRRMDNPSDKNSLNQPTWDYWSAYSTVDAAINYKINNLNVALNINNILDKYYFLGGFDYTRAFPGAPFNLMFSLSYSFYKN